MRTLRPKPKLLVLNFPHNPTTATVSLDFFEDMARLARRQRLFVVSDLAYGATAFDGYRPPSFLQARYGKDVGVELTTMSKEFNMAGWRVGYCVGNRDAVEALGRVKAYYDYGLFQPLQIASIIALRHCIPDGAAQALLYQKRRDVLCDGLERAGWELQRPKATMFVWAPDPGTLSEARLGPVRLRADGKSVRRRRAGRGIRRSGRRVSAARARREREAPAPGRRADPPRVPRGTTVIDSDYRIRIETNEYGSKCHARRRAGTADDRRQDEASRGGAAAGDRRAARRRADRATAQREPPARRRAPPRRDALACRDNRPSPEGKPQKVDAHSVRKLVDELNAEYAAQGRAFEVVEIAGGFQLLTRPEFKDWVAELHRRAAAGEAHAVRGGDAGHRRLPAAGPARGGGRHPRRAERPAAAQPARARPHQSRRPPERPRPPDPLRHLAHLPRTFRPQVPQGPAPRRANSRRRNAMLPRRAKTGDSCILPISLYGGFLRVRGRFGFFHG